MLAKSQNTNAIFPGDKTPEQFFAQKCAVCHGKKGEKNSMLPTMRVMNKISKDEQIGALAQLIASFGEK